MVPIRWSLLGRRVVLMVVSIAVVAGCGTDRRTLAAGIDPLPAWNDGASKAAIVDFVTDAEMKIIAAPVDFVGINVYIPSLLVMASDQPSGYRQVPFNISHPKMFSSWHRLLPESQYWSPRLLYSLWKPREIYITENGCAASDVVAADGHVYDSDRLTYLRNGMRWQQQATAEGIPLKGNFYWSAMDNLEWTDGFGTRFGLVYVDFKTQKRTPKLSAQWFREASRRNAVV